MQKKWGLPAVKGNSSLESQGFYDFASKKPRGRKQVAGNFHNFEKLFSCQFLKDSDRSTINGSLYDNVRGNAFQIDPVGREKSIEKRWWCLNKFNLQNDIVVLSFFSENAFA